MFLLDKILTRQEVDNLLESIKGNINRICVSDDQEEIICQLGFATDYLHMIAYSKIKAVGNKSCKN